MDGKQEAYFTLIAERKDGDRKQIGTPSSDVSYIKKLKHEVLRSIEHFNLADRTLLIYDNDGKVIN